MGDLPRGRLKFVHANYRKSSNTCLMSRQNAKILHGMKITDARRDRTKLKSLYYSKILSRKTCLGIFLVPFCCIPFWLLALFCCVLWFRSTSDALTVHLLLFLESNVLLGEISAWVFLVVFVCLVLTSA